MNFYTLFHISIINLNMTKSNNLYDKKKYGNTTYKYLQGGKSTKFPKVFILFFEMWESNRALAIDDLYIHLSVPAYNK
jgi:hypothetical protein